MDAFLGMLYGKGKVLVAFPADGCYNVSAIIELLCRFAPFLRETYLLCLRHADR